MACLLEGVDSSHFGPLSGFGMAYECDLCTSGIATTRVAFESSFFNTSLQGHVSCPSLPDCVQDSAPRHLVIPGSEWQRQ